MGTPRCQVLGVKCFCGGLTDAVGLIIRRIEDRRGGYACFCNAHVLVTAAHETELRASLDEAWMLFPDGAPVAFMQRRAGHRDAERVPGPEVMPLIVGHGQERGLRHYLLGSSDDVLRRLTAALQTRYPAALVVGSSSPRIDDGARSHPELAGAVRAAEPDVVWCALGAPKQELWMRANHRLLAPALLLGVGAAFDFLAGTKKRAPQLLRSLGLEWLHRLASEPRRLSGRYLRTNSEFAVRAAADLLRARR